MTNQQIKIVDKFSEILGIETTNYDERYDFIMNSCTIEYNQIDCPLLCIPVDKQPMDGVTQDICHKCWLIAIEQYESEK